MKVQFTTAIAIQITSTIKVVALLGCSASSESTTAVPPRPRPIDPRGHHHGRKRARTARPRDPASRHAAHPGVHPLVDLGADSLDQALSHRAVVVPAKFGVRCRCRANLIPRRSLQANKLHRDSRRGPACRGTCEA